MLHYIRNIIDNWTENITVTSLTSAAEELFSDGKGEPLPKDKAVELHTIIAKGIFVCKRDRPDIHPTISGICNRVQYPTIENWKIWK